MPSPPTHLSNASVQMDVEAVIVAALAIQERTPLSTQGNRIRIDQHTHIEVDAVSEDGKTVVEAYARQGRLKGAQVKKIAQDVLKLALLKRQPGREDTKAIIVFASQDAHDSISGWLRQAAETFDVRLAVVDIPDDLRERILQAQTLQVMVNAEQVADDVAVETAE